MADSVEMQDIRGLEIDKAVKGFAEVEYVFKKVCQVSNTTADSIRWYQETAGDLTAATPSYVANISPLSQFPILEKTWTRQTSYVRKYAAEGFISMEDAKSADIDVIARTLNALTRAVVKQVDTRIWNVISDAAARTAATGISINVVTSTGWAGTSLIKDIIGAKKAIAAYDYNPEGARLFISPQNNLDMLTYLIDTKGSSIPNFSSEKIKDGVVMSLLGVDVVVSNNVAASGSLLVIPQRAATWKTFTDTTSRAIEDPGLGTKIRVWEMGECILTDPRAVCFISGS